MEIGPYDYGSVMHYTFKGNLNPIPPGIPFGYGGPRPSKSSARGLSPGDIDGISRLYGNVPARTIVTTNPVGLKIEVDGEFYASPHSFDWAPGTHHNISVASPQNDIYDHYKDRTWNRDYSRYLFAKWSDEGTQSHFIKASETTVFIADFIEQIRPELSSEPMHGGTVRLDPPSADGFYPTYSLVRSIAEPAKGFSFKGWKPHIFTQRDGGFATNPTLSIVSQHHPALFTRKPLTTLDTNVLGTTVTVDGSQVRLPAAFAWEAGSTHTLDLLYLAGGCCPGVIQYGGGGRLIFNGWSDGGGNPHEIIASGEATTIKANFKKQFSLRTDVQGPGTIEVRPSGLEVPGVDCGLFCNGPGKTYHEPSSTVLLTAKPSPGFKFVTWLGDLSGNENPKSLHMDLYKRVRAVFADSRSRGEVSVSEPKISATVPVFGFPASLFIKTVKGKNPPPQSLEISASGGEMLDYQITADQPWLSISPDRGSSTGETDTVEIAVDPENMELGVFEGAVTISAPSAQPVEIPVTLLVDEVPFALDFAHFASGDGLTTDLVFVNASTRFSRREPVRLSLYFHDEEGNRIAPESIVDLKEDMAVMEDAGLDIMTEIGPLEQLTISTHGRGEVVRGSVKAVSDGFLGGVLRFDLPGIGVAGVGISEPVRSALLPARRKGGLSTAVAIHNPREYEISVSCRLMEEGAIWGEDRIHLPGYGQQARFIQEMFPHTDTSDFVGVVHCVSSDPFSGVAVELDAANRIFTTLPIVPVR